MNRGNGSDQASMDYSLKYNPPMDPAVTERNLREIKGVLEELGVVFLLGSGSCLGAVRDKAFIPWDDDVDLLAVIGVNGLTDEKVDSVASALRDKGYYVAQADTPKSKPNMSIKDHARISLEALRIIEGCVYSYPGIALAGNNVHSPQGDRLPGRKVQCAKSPRGVPGSEVRRGVDDSEEGRGV